MNTSGMEMVGPLIEATAVSYFAGIDCVLSKGEKGRSKSRRGGTVVANKLLGRELGCCRESYNFKC